jgi:uncharacterized protein (DUF924 family)
MQSANDILDYWFGPPPFDAARLDERSNFWFGNGTPDEVAAQDAEIREKLGPLLERAERGELDAWAGSPRRRLALILLFDQAPRNIFRGSAKAFSYDERAQALAAEGMQLAADQALQAHERLFFYMPLEHAESMEAQDACLAAMQRLAADATPALRDYFTSIVGYAKKHRAVIEKFGRFPHRNKVLGREDTPAEREWLAAGADRFGQ